MRKSTLILAGLGVGLAVPASATILEDFEHGNTGLYTLATAGNNMTIIGAAAHDGQLGANFAGNVASGFYYRTDVPTAPGLEYRGYVRFHANGGAGGRLYMGVSASAGGAWSAVAASNTSSIILQNNTGWGFVNTVSAAMTFTDNTWYQLGLEWAANGDMRVNLYDEPGTSLLAQTPWQATGNTTPGGLSLRGFHNGAGSSVDFDTFQAVPEPATLLALGAGLAALAARRRK
ncbi:MAG: hypothetical protein AKCLJLPJ_00220 [Fimbriimonadales bacterium]|nr:MAG: PEP-CTERM sorting domain-containing protein [Armatimonadota bacterium]MBV6502177.1 hypothetical protein [Fimbriimonadales bacterium]MCE7899015.1 PEP-CTERM sorting domain-containing protein [Armatimonadetes bacterium ATM1]MDL1927470.1 PEP-CTERM sorting domain-containing protein [Fimbriimonadia bacterium ATM]MBC6969747.1 PEP-CTERM sorting domain-containing protein [Armatimonadota bacterium]